MDVASRIKEFVVSNFYVSDPAELTPSTELVGSGLIDSTGMLEVVSFLETEFGIKIRDEEMLPENLGSIGQIAAFVGRKRAAGAAAA